MISCFYLLTSRRSNIGNNWLAKLKKHTIKAFNQYNQTDFEGIIGFMTICFFRPIAHDPFYFALNNFLQKTSFSFRFSSDNRKWKLFAIDSCAIHLQTSLIIQLYWNGRPIIIPSEKLRCRFVLAVNHKWKFGLINCSLLIPMTPKLTNFFMYPT